MLPHCWVNQSWWMMSGFKVVIGPRGEALPCGFKGSTLRRHFHLPSGVISNVKCSSGFKERRLDKNCTVCVLVHDMTSWHQAPACHGDAFQQKRIVAERKHLKGLWAEGATLVMVVMVTILPISSHLTPHPFSVGDTSGLQAAGCFTTQLSCYITNHNNN